MPTDEAYRGLVYCGPSLPYLGQMAVIGGVPSMSYPVVPLAGGGLPGQMGPPSPHSGYSSHPEPQLNQAEPYKPSSSAADVSSGNSAYPPEKGHLAKQTYKEALDQQVKERDARRRKEREENERYEAKLEADMKHREPWGRGGGGAPLRDSTGNLITDLKQMHRINEEAYINPDTWQKKATAHNLAVVREEVLREDRPPSNDRVLGGFTHVQIPQVSRGREFTSPSQPTERQLLEQDKYKTYLKQQIEEKRRKEAEERENMRLEEEREERKLAEQRAQILREFKEEQDAKKRKEMELKAKNEELTRLAEQRKKEEVQKKKEAEEKQNTALRKQYERERQTRLEEEHRQPSPPIPTLQRKGMTSHQHSPRPPTLDSRRSTAAMSECSLSGLQSPPVPARRNQLRAAEDQRYVISELSALRKKLRSEQRRVEAEHLQADWEWLDSPLTDRCGSRSQVDAFDMARLCLPAPVRRPPCRNPEPSNLFRIHDSLQLRYPECETRYGSSEVAREEAGSVDLQIQAEQRSQHRRMTRRRAAHDYFDLSLAQQPDQYLRITAGDPQTCSLLESESAFIEPLGDVYPVPHTPEQRTPQLSARERRRLARKNDPHEVPHLPVPFTVQAS